MPGVGVWPYFCLCPCPLWHISDIRGSREVGYAKPRGYCNTVCSSVPPVTLSAEVPYCPAPQLPLLSHLPILPPSQALPSSCAALWTHTAHIGSASPCRAAAPHPSPERDRERLALSLSSGGAAGRAAWRAHCWPQHPQPRSKGCQTSLSSPRVSQTFCQSTRGDDGEGEWCWLDPCGVALLLSPAVAGAALPFPR